MSGRGAAVLRMEGVVKRFGAKTVLDGLSAEFHAGELTLIRGRRNAGKTTLARILAGQTRPDRGTVRRTGPAAPLIGGAWGFGGGMSTMAGLDLRAAAHGLDSRDYIAAVAALFENPDVLRRPFGELRGADRTLLTFGAGYLTPAALYVVDGAPLPIDPRTRQALAPLFDAARARAAVVWVADDAIRAAPFAPDRFLRLEDGRLAPDDPSDRPAKTAPARDPAETAEADDG